MPYARSLMILLFITLTPVHAAAFCGMFVSGAPGKLYNESTQVALMRHETTTILSMRNSYKGPAKDFAMVVPVPIVLKKDDVVTLDDAIFDQLDKHTAPRLVEYWEQDPCPDRLVYGRGAGSMGMRGTGTGGGGDGFGRVGGLGVERKTTVKVEAKFEVDEYEVVLLSSEEAGDLETWLVDNKYNIPGGASEVLQSYIAQGMYFFVAKVDIDKVELDKEGRAMLSPLRFHYESEDFQLPIRLGLLNADGPQDLLIHTIGPDRYEVANHDNTTIPTNLIVKKKVKKKFDSFYRTLFDHTLSQYPHAVVTEYAWPTSVKCDPCTLAGGISNTQLRPLGLDLIEQRIRAEDKGSESKRLWLAQGKWVVTRLHARYTAEDSPEDLIFKTADPIEGGLGTPQGKYGKMKMEGASTSTINKFQGRYVLFHTWYKELTCEAPDRYIWGGPRRKTYSGFTPKVSVSEEPVSSSYEPVDLADVIHNPNAPGLGKLE